MSGKRWVCQNHCSKRQLMPKLLEQRESFSIGEHNCPLVHKDNVVIRSIQHFTVLSRPRSCRKPRGCAAVHVWKEPLSYFPRGLPGIISHYPRHSSNTAGARKNGCLVSARLPHVWLPFFLPAALSLACPRGGLSQCNSLEKPGRCKFINLRECCSVVIEREKGSKKEAQRFFCPSPVLCPQF